MPGDPVTPARVGYYGKLPSRGDFLRGSLPRAVAAGWDGWMEAVLAPAQARLGETWCRAWGAQRPWRFSIDAGLCGDAPVCGVWLASADRVGRSFPFVLARVAGAPTEAFLGAAEAAAAALVAGTLAPEDLAGLFRDGGRPQASGGSPRPGGGARSRWWRGDERAAGDAFDAPGWPDAEAFVRMVQS